MSLIAYAGPFFALFILLELWWDRRQATGYIRLNDSVNSLSLGILSTASKLVVYDIGALILLSVGERFGLFAISLDSMAAWVITFIGYDFLYYWFHRISHERQLFWGAHVAHHQSEEFNLTTALRQTSMSFFYAWLFFIPCFVIGVPAEMYFTVASVNLLYQFWVHTRHINRLGWFDYVFVSPSNHRVHHARNIEYLDRNYGGVFILWDRLFGTFEDERDTLPVEYGIRKPLHSWNPIRANVHVFQAMLADAWRTDSWRNKFKVLFARTGWQPDDLQPHLTDEAPAKFNPAVTKAAQYYALAALVSMYLWGSYYIFAFIEASLFMRSVGLVFIMLTLIEAGLALEGGRERRALQWLRRICLLTALALLAADAMLQSTVMGYVYVFIAASFVLAWICLVNKPPLPKAELL